jgi:hypothetical protein
MLSRCELVWYDRYRWSVQSPSGADISNITTYVNSINGLTVCAVLLGDQVAHRNVDQYVLMWPFGVQNSSTRYGTSKLVLTRGLLTAPATYSVVLSLYNFLGYR